MTIESLVFSPQIPQLSRHFMQFTSIVEKASATDAVVFIQYDANKIFSYITWWHLLSGEFRFTISVGIHSKYELMIATDCPFSKVVKTFLSCRLVFLRIEQDYHPIVYDDVFEVLCLQMAFRLNVPQLKEHTQKSNKYNIFFHHKASWRSRLSIYSISMIVAYVRYRHGKR